MLSTNSVLSRLALILSASKLLMITYDYPTHYSKDIRIHRRGRKPSLSGNHLAQLDTEVINALIKVTKDIKHINYNRWESNFKAKETVAIR